MSENLELMCRCGQIHGSAKAVSPRHANRVICYCDDCQAFLHYLGRPELLDAHGGTDVIQVPPNVIEFDRGTSNIAGLRLTDKGMHRWYASCCKTPLGNTVTPAIPFIGIPLELFLGAGQGARLDEIFGKPRNRVMAKFAIGHPDHAAAGITPGVIIGAITKVMSWKLSGKTWPHPYFEKTTGAPKYPLTILTPAQRDALRPLCGPTPKAPA